MVTEGSKAEPRDAVEIFVKPGCPYCRALKSELGDCGTPFVEHNVQSEAASLQRMLTLNGGRRSVPTMLTGGKVTVGFHGT